MRTTDLSRQVPHTPARRAAHDLNRFECGAGPRTVVLLHGYTDSWRSFRRVLPGLARTSRCLAVDLRSHGESRYAGDDLAQEDLAGDVVAFLEGAGIGPATLIGHSMGSFLARRVALSRPELVDRLVLVGSGLRADNPVVRGLAAEVASFGEVVPRPFVEAFQASCLHDRADLPGWFFDDCVEASLALPARAWKAVLAGMLEADDRDRLGQIPHPTLVVGGREDAIFGIGEQEQLARVLPRGRLVAYERCGHSPHWERPGRFVADVQWFLDEPA